MCGTTDNTADHPGDVIHIHHGPDHNHRTDHRTIDDAAHLDNGAASHH